MDALLSTITSSTKPDLYINGPRGTRIPADAAILASASPVLDNMIKSNRIVEIRGVPYDAVTAFVRFLYTSRCSEEDMENYGIHLLSLSHAYSVPKLKQSCVTGLSKLATIENVVDVLHLARLCDAPDLYLNCAMLIRKKFRSVKKTEGWKFLHTNDPRLEKDIVQFINEDKSRKSRMKRQREEQEVIMQLSEAMECLEHICTEGCTSVAPYDVDVKEQRKRMPCSKFSTCQGLQVLIRHFATCEKRVKGGCMRCKRLWQLFRLHSCICIHQDSCKVPLCRQFHLKMEKENKEDDASWKLLVRKVGSAKAMSSLQQLLKR
ncbi:BTB/POZ and TAZ domain-containing protein 1-like [Vicia villosa]|uniref:BTB/POZ and TAZ domain-containing protein 1-like n=1 Tax=Vicia villosa TaxID=3911 RepID=UPI00273C25D9|nr:BTB/POZ and TAZ domain-containing protein 1-like [Vicia villosa]